MKTINYIDEKFIEKMKKEKIAIEASDELMQRLEELGVVCCGGHKPTECNDWKYHKEQRYVDLYWNKGKLAPLNKNWADIYNYDLYEYQPLTEQQRIEHAIEKYKTKIKNLTKRLEELNKPKWDIYKEVPNIDDDYYFINTYGEVVTNGFDDHDLDEYRFNNLILHKTKESAGLEIAFRKELNARRKKFEFEKLNYQLDYNYEFGVEIGSSKYNLINKYCFTYEDAKWLLDNFPHEVIKAVLFDIKE